MQASDLIARLNPNKAYLVCSNNSDATDSTEYTIPVHTCLEPPADDAQLEALREMLGDMPGAEIWLDLFRQHNGFGLFAVAGTSNPAILIAPPGEWADLREEMFGWFFEGVEEEFEGLPFGPDDVFPFALREDSPDRWIVVRSGPNAGMIHFWGHDGEPIEPTPWAESLAEFVDRLTSEDAPTHFGGLVRYGSNHPFTPKPPEGTELYPMRYRAKSD